MNVNRLTVVIAGPPFAEPRVRATIRGRHASVYRPKESEDFRAHARLAMLKAVAQYARDAHEADRPLLKFPLEERVELRIAAIFPCSDKVSTSSYEPAWHTGLRDGDADNLAVALMNAGNGVLWRDDGYVSRLVVDRVTGPRLDAGVAWVPHPGVVVMHVERLNDPRAHAKLAAAYGPEASKPPRVPVKVARARARRSGAPRRRLTKDERERRDDPIGYFAKRALDAGSALADGASRLADELGGRS